MKKVFHKKWFSRIQSAVACVLILFLCFSFFLLDRNRSVEKNVLFCVLALSILILDFCMRRIVRNIFDKMSNQEKEVLRQQQMRTEIQLSSQTRKYEETVFRVHHDMKNHLGVIRSMLADGDEKQAQEYLKKLRSFLNREGIEDD